MKKILTGILFISLVLAIVACTGKAKTEKPLAVSQADPVVDGVIQINEYANTFDFDVIKLYVSRTPDTFNLAVSAKTTGWVAIGAGSKRMDGATMFIGYADKDKTVFSEQTGIGHGHSQVPADRRIATKSAIKEEGGMVTLEVECSASSLITAGAKELSLIIASSPDDSFSGGHSVRRPVTVPLE